MEKLEKVIIGLAACMPQTEEDAAIGCDGCPYNEHPCGGDYQDNDHVNLPVAMIEDIRALLKAQEPLSVKYTTSTIRCPKCNKQITSRGSIHNEIKFCWKCGQAVKW